VILALQTVLGMRVPETPSVALTRRAGFSFVLRLKGRSARPPTAGACTHKSPSLGEDAWQLTAQEPQSLPHGDAALQQEGADLIDDAGALTDQSLAYAMERLQVELLSGLGSDESHRGALNCFGDRLSITEVVLLPPRSRDAHIWLASAERRGQAM
jgi:hypothetical protein